MQNGMIKKEEIKQSVMDMLTVNRALESGEKLSVFTDLPSPKVTPLV